MTADASEYQELVDWLTIKVAGYVNVPPDTIGIDIPLADCGIDSTSGLTLCADLLDEKSRGLMTLPWLGVLAAGYPVYLIWDRWTRGRTNPPPAP